MDKTVFYIIAALLAVYIFISMSNKKRSKKRRNRKFMDDYQRKEKK